MSIPSPTPTVIEIILHGGAVLEEGEVGAARLTAIAGVGAPSGATLQVGSFSYLRSFGLEPDADGAAGITLCVVGIGCMPTLHHVVSHS